MQEFNQPNDLQSQRRLGTNTVRWDITPETLKYRNETLASRRCTAKKKNYRIFIDKPGSPYPCIAVIDRKIQVLNPLSETRQIWYRNSF